MVEDARVETMIVSQNLRAFNEECGGQIIPSFSSTQEESTGQNTRIVLRGTLTHTDDPPGNHDPRHPLAGREALEQQRRRRLEEHVRVVEDTDHPSPLLAVKAAELESDPVAGFEVHDRRVGDVLHVDAHDQVDE